MVYSKDALVHKVSADLPPAHAAFAEPLSCALHAVERADIKFDDVVVVAGCGPIGLGMIAGAKSKNPRLVIGLDMAQDKLDLALECGADLVINIGKEDAVAKVKELTDGYGADVYIEGTGHPSAVGQGLNLLRKLGTYVEYSVFGSDVTVDWSIISDDKELDVRGAHLGPHCWPAAIRMIESGPAADGQDLHPPAAARRLPEGPRPGGQRQGVDQGLADPLRPPDPRRSVGPARAVNSRPTGVAPVEHRRLPLTRPPCVSVPARPDVHPRLPVHHCR